MSKKNRNRSGLGLESAPEALPLPLPEPEPAQESAEDQPEPETTPVAETQLAPEPVAAIVATPPEPAQPPEPPKATAPARITFNADGQRFEDMPKPLGVRCEALVNVLWLGMTAGPGTELTLPAKDAERLERRGIVKRL